jgi:hypothetical protein
MKAKYPQYRKEKNRLEVSEHHYRTNLPNHNNVIKNIEGKKKL